MSRQRKNTKTLNRHQKKAFRVDEKRVSRAEVEDLLIMSRSADPEDRALAASYLCPCHVRRRIDAVWEALFRMMEDDNAQVRRNAWHTLEDGGKPEDPRLDAILDRTLEHETDKQVLRFAKLFAAPRHQKNQMDARLAGRSAYTAKGKCDFCGTNNVNIKKEYDTLIPSGNTPRPALVCQKCG